MLIITYGATDSSNIDDHISNIFSFMTKQHTKQHEFVVLAYKDSVYLEACLQSLLAQTVRSEITIATSTPTADQQRLAAQYDVVCRVNHECKNIASDWNFALSCAGAKFVTLAHQDDVYCTDYTEVMLASVCEQEDFLIAFSDYTQITNVASNNLVVAVKRMILMSFFNFRSVLKRGFTQRALLSFGCSICCPSVMYNKARVKKLKFDETFSVNLDWKCWIDLTHHDGVFVYVKKVLLNYRPHGATTTNLAISSGLRKAEDRRCFNLLWPNFIVGIIAKVYALGYAKNKQG